MYNDIFPLPSDDDPLSLDMYNGESTIPTIFSSFCVNIGLSFSSKSSFSILIVFPIFSSELPKYEYFSSNKHSSEFSGNLP